MEYRILPHGGEKIGVIGMGSSVVGAQKEADIIRTVRTAFDLGVNYFDMAGGHASIFPAYGKALKDIRRQVFLQVHFGADYTTGEYGWTTKLDEIKRSVAWQLENLQTDYIDFGFIHCLDEEADLRTYEKNGILRYLQDLQRQGVVRHLGLSSHAPRLANRVLDMRIIDMLMFSINPAFDMLPASEDSDTLFAEEFSAELKGIDPEHAALYSICEQHDVGIAVMKPFAGGRLFDAKRSPFGVSLTPVQCIHYALTRPAVSSVLCGYDTKEQVDQAVAYENASREEKDFASVIANAPLHAYRGQCTYCGHCKPCPAGLDIGMINKFYDLATMQPEVPATVRSHYEALEHTASACIGCRSCESRCPFGVPIAERMEKAAALFGC